MCVISDHDLLSEVTHIYYTNQYNLSSISTYYYRLFFISPYHNQEKINGQITRLFMPILRVELAICRNR